MGLYDRDYALAPEALERTRAKAREGCARKPASFAGVRVPDALPKDLVLRRSRIEPAKPPHLARRKRWLTAVVCAITHAMRMR